MPEDYVYLQVPRVEWELLLDTLVLDSKSMAFDAGLREDIANAIYEIKYLVLASSCEAIDEVL